MHINIRKTNRRHYESSQYIPEGYREICSINLQKDKKTAVIVNLTAAAVMIALIVLMHFIVPIYSIFDFTYGMTDMFIRLGSLIFFAVAYIFLHELVHGIAMKICGTKKVKYGLTSLYAYTASEELYFKGAYIFIALALVVFLGIVIAVVNLFVPVRWFWIVYFIQTVNLSGAVGDLYVTSKILRLPKNILIQDSGIEMRIFSD